MRQKLLYPSLALLLAVFLHLTCAYDFYYAEQFRVFRWSADYVVPFFGQIGGPVSLWTSFLLQFYYLPGIGAVCTAVAFLLMATGTTALLRRIAPKWPLAVFGVSAGLMQCALATETHYSLEQSWAVIAAVWTLVGIALSWEAAKTFTSKKAGAIALRTASIIMLVAALLYTCGPVVWGEYYYSTMLHASAHSHWPLCTVVLGIVTAGILSRQPLPAWLQTEKHRGYFVTAELLMAVVFGAWYFTQCHTAGSVRLKQLDYYRTSEQWDQILAMPDLPTDKIILYTNYQNLALAATGRLGEEFMQRGQTGTFGLQQVWQGAQFESDLLSDIFMQQGHVAMAQKMAFTAMQGNRGMIHGRMMLRLIETNLILGADKVAEKYINILSQTLHYKERAEAYRKFVGHPELVTQDRRMGELQRCTQGCDWCPNDLEEGLKQIIEANPSYRNALEYLGCYYMLNNNPEKFKDFLDTYYAYPGLNPMPQSFARAAQSLLWQQPRKEESK